MTIVPLAIVLAVVAVLLVAGLLAYLVFRIVIKSRAHKERAATVLGFTPQPEPDAGFRRRIVELYSYSPWKPFKLSRVAHKLFPDGDLYLFDLQETSGDDPSTLVEGGLVVLSRHLNLPQFMLWPKVTQGGPLAGLANRFLRWAYSQGGVVIDLSEYPDFDSRYVLTGGDEGAVRAFFTPALIDQLSSLPDYNLLGGGDSFAVMPGLPTGQNTEAHFEALQARVSDALQILYWFLDFGGEMEAGQVEAGLDGEGEPEPVGFEQLRAEMERVNSSPVARGFTMGRAGCLILFGLTWTLFSMVFLGIALVTYNIERDHYELLNAEGVPVRGVVTGRYEDSDSDGDSTYTVAYRYPVPGPGEPVYMDANQSVSYQVYRSLRPGQEVDILYAGSEPGVAELQATFGPPDIFLPVCFGGIGGLFMLIGIGIAGGGAISASMVFQLTRSATRRKW